MQIVFASDIFGFTPWTQRLTQHWLNIGYKVALFTPYSKAVDGAIKDLALQAFSCEKQAYQAFSAEGGFEYYCDHIAASLPKPTEPCLYLGFSAGGAALWRVLSQCSAAKTSHLLAFYPGQIRHHLTMLPPIATTLVLPQREEHFDLSVVIEYLVTKQQVNLIQNHCLHGYANPDSKNYNSSVSNALFDVLTHAYELVKPEVAHTRILSLPGNHRRG